MDKQTFRDSSVGLRATVPSSPQWWGDKHTSAWDRVKEALRRDWEQTKADFSSNAGVELNQNIGDTVKQAVGKEPVPPLSVKTHPDDIDDVEKRVLKELKDVTKAKEKVIEARHDIAEAQVKAQGKIAREEEKAQEKVAKEQQKMGEIQADAQKTLLEDQRKAQEKLASQQQKIAEVRTETAQKIGEVRQEVTEKVAKEQQKVAEALDWPQAEAAIRYGYGARMEYGDASVWDPQVEGRLRDEWTELKSGSAWEDARRHVRHGWDFATRNKGS